MVCTYCTAGLHISSAAAIVIGRIGGDAERQRSNLHNRGPRSSGVCHMQRTRQLRQVHLFLATCSSKCQLVSYIDARADSTLPPAAFTAISTYTHVAASAKQVLGLPNKFTGCPKQGSRLSSVALGPKIWYSEKYLTWKLGYDMGLMLPT